MKPSFALETFPDDRRMYGVQKVGRDVVQALRAMPFSEGARVEQTFTAGQTVAIPHKLGRQPQGWFVVDVTTGDGTFRRTAWDATTVSIRSANACTAAFWVF